MLSRCFWDFSVGVGAFVMGLSRISPLFSCTRSHGGFAQFVIRLLAVLSVLLFVRLKSERYDNFVLK